MDAFKKISQKLKDKKHGWELWGKAFVLYSLKNYNDKFRKDQLLSKKKLAKAYKLVGDTYNLWESVLEDINLGSRGLEIKDMFLSLSNFLQQLKAADIRKDGSIKLKESRIAYPYDYATLVGVLRCHLMYFLGSWHIWRYLPQILGKSRDALMKTLQRSQYKKIDFLKEYRSEVSIFTSQILHDYLFKDEVKMKELSQEMERFYKWCEEKEAAL